MAISTLQRAKNLCAIGCESPSLGPSYANLPAYSPLWSLAEVYDEIGRFDEASKCYQSAIQSLTSNPNLACKTPIDVFYSHAIHWLYRGDISRAQKYLSDLASQSQSYVGYFALVYKKVLAYIDERNMPSVSYETSIRNWQKEGNYGSYVAYETLLSRLTNFELSENISFTGQEERPLVECIGESHILGYKALNGMTSPYRFKLRWVPGIKVWHLTSGQSNRYRALFENCFSNIPKSSNVILCVGEIDLRADGGLLTAARRAKRRPEIALEELVRDYGRYLASLNSRFGHRIILQAVPRHYSMATVAEGSDSSDEVKELREIFNDQIKMCADRHEFRFIDPNQGTGKLLSNEEQLLDGVHFHPRALSFAVSSLLRTQL